MISDDDLDRAFSERIVPSSGFVGDVMATVLREASAPPPIPFPWKRALPGLLAGALAFVALIVVFLKDASRPASAAPIQDGLLPVLSHASEIAKMYGIGWVLFTLLLTLACVTVSVRLTAGTWRTR